MDNATQPLPDFDKMWDFGRPAETERAFVKLLESTKQTGQPFYCAELMTQIARAQGLQRRFDEGHQTLDQVKSSVDLALSPKLQVRYLLERGRLFNSAKNIEAAKPQFVEAFEVASAAGEDHRAIDAAHMLGICESPEEAIRWNYKAIAVAERSADRRAQNWLGPLLNNLGWTLHDKGEYPQAIELFERALAFRQSRGREPEIRIAKWAIARTLRSLSRVEEALAKQESLKAEWEATGESDGYVFEELGECCHSLGREEQARQHFRCAYELLSKDANFVADEPKRLLRLKQMAGLND